MFVKFNFKFSAIDLEVEATEIFKYIVPFSEREI